MPKIKSSEIETYLNITPESPHVLGSLTATYARAGDGIVTGNIEMNPATTEEQYIAEDSGTTSVDSYAPAQPIEQQAKINDPVFDFVDQLRLDCAIAGDVITDIVNVWNYETGGPTAAPAEQQLVSIAYETFGGPGGGNNALSYSIDYIGTAVTGTFNRTTKVFTAT